MPKVITLSGIQTAQLPRRDTRCTPVKATNPFGEEVIMCAETYVDSVKRRPGRPKGSGKGSRVWKGKSCSSYRWITDKRGVRRCQCQDSGSNKSFAPASKCRRED